MELLTLFRFRSNVEWIWRPKPFKSHLPRAGIFTVYLYICQNFHLWKLWGTLYCKGQLLPYQISRGIFRFSWAVTSFGSIFCSVVTYYLLTTNFFFFFGKRYQKAGTSWLYLLSLSKLGRQLQSQAKHLYIMEVVSGRILFQKLYVFHRMTLQRSYRIVSSSLLSPWYCCFYHILFLWSLTFFRLPFFFPAKWYMIRGIVFSSSFLFQFIY